MGAVGQADAGRGAADLLDRDHVLEIAQAAAAILLLDRHAEQAQLAELGPQLARELVAAVDLLGQRCDLARGEARHRVADHLRLLAQVEAHARGM